MAQFTGPGAFRIAQDAALEHLNFANSGGVKVNGSAVSVAKTTFNNCGIEVDWAAFLHITDNLFLGSVTAIALNPAESGIDGCLIADNQFAVDQFIDFKHQWSGQTHIADNVGYGPLAVGVFGETVNIVNNRTLGGGPIDIEVVTNFGYHIVIANNDLDGGAISVTFDGDNSGEGALIQGNYVYAPTGDGIRVHDAAEVTVLGNQIKYADNAGIRVSGTSENNTVQANRVSTCSVGVEISDATCVGTVVVANRLDEDVTTPIVDNGTGTILNYPNDATYGDNFVS